MTRKLKIDTNYESGTLTFTPLNADGSKVDIDSLVVNANDLSSAMQTHSMLHGLKQKLSDKLGKITEAPAILEAVSEVFSGLLDNNWSIRGAGGGTKVTQFIADLVTVTGNTPENLIPWFKALSDVEQAQIRKSPDIAAAKAARIKAAALVADKAAKKAVSESDGTSDLFAGIAG